ncbi:MAG TPA: hypothetical protein VI029_18270 [Mycobacterium sp.]
MYLTARSYLLAGFTAASIVATIPFAPRTTVHMPDIHAADVRLAAAESQIAATVRTLRAVEARAVASTVEGAATTVLPDLARRSTAAAAVTVPVSVAGPVVGDVVALAFDLSGTQATLMNSLSFVADDTIATLTGATAEDLPPGFGFPQRLNVITADLNNLAGAINHLTGFVQSGPGVTGAPQTGVKTGSVAASNSGTGTAALLPLIGDVAILGVDMTAAPFAMTQTVTRALAAASTDLGAGELGAAQTDFTTILGAGLTESQTRIAKDKNNIGAVLARLVGLPSTTTRQTGPANSVAGATSALGAAKTASAAASRSHPSNVGPGPVVTRPRSSAPAGTATAGSSTVSPRGSSRTPEATAKPTPQRGNTTGTTKPATQSPTGADGQSPTKAGDSANGTSTSKHSAPAKPHKDGAKHRKH